MPASTETQVGSNIFSPENELFGPFEYFGITVGSGVAQGYWFVRTYCFAMQVNIFRSGSCEAPVRAVQPDKFFHCRWYESGILSEPFLELLVLGQVVTYRPYEDGRCDDTDDQGLSEAATRGQSDIEHRKK